MDLEAWVYSTAAAANGVAFITEAYAGDTRIRYTLGFDRDSGSDVQGGVFDGSWQRVLNTVSVSTDAWYHFATTYDGAAIRLYRNGAEVGTALTYSGTPDGEESI